MQGLYNAAASAFTPASANPAPSPQGGAKTVANFTDALATNFAGMAATTISQAASYIANNVGPMVENPTGTLTQGIYDVDKGIASVLPGAKNAAPTTNPVLKALNTPIATNTSIDTAIQTAWKNAANATVGAEAAPLMTAYKNMAANPNIQPSQAYAQAMNSGDFKTLTSEAMLPETIYRLGPQMAAAITPFFINPAAGFFSIMGPTAYNVSQEAQKSGMSVQASNNLGMGTGALVGYIYAGLLPELMNIQDGTSLSSKILSGVIDRISGLDPSAAGSNILDTLAEAAAKDPAGFMATEPTSPEMAQVKANVANRAGIKVIAGNPLFKIASGTIEGAGANAAASLVQSAAKAVINGNPDWTQTEKNAYAAAIIGGITGGIASAIVTGAKGLIDGTNQNEEFSQAPTQPAPQGLIGAGEEPPAAQPGTEPAPTTPNTPAPVAEAPLSSEVADNAPGAVPVAPAAPKSLMEQMKSGDTMLGEINQPPPAFQRAIDTHTMASLKIGDPAAPSAGSAYEVDNHLFIVRDVSPDGSVTGYKVPVDGTSTLSMTNEPAANLKPFQGSVDAIKQSLKATNVPMGVARSEQFITNPQATANIRRYFNENELPVAFVKNINTPDGGAAFGKYTKGLVTFINNPHETTPDHEAVHAYLDLFMSGDERLRLYEAAREQTGNHSMSDQEAEEWLANRFVNYVRDGQRSAGEVQKFFDKTVDALHNSIKPAPIDRINDLFQRITNKVRPTEMPVEAEVKAEYFQKPDKLTAKLLTLPEFANRNSVGRQFISDLMNSTKANLKLPEKLILEDVLNTQFKDQKEIDLQAFKKAVAQQLLPLKRQTFSNDTMNGESAPFSSIVLPQELRGEVGEYQAHIYESPIKTSAGKQHFPGQTEKYFAHTRTEDMADGETRRVIEIQSDLFQRGRLEQEGTGHMKVKDHLIDERNAEIARLEPYRQSWFQRIIREEIRQAAIDGIKKIQIPTGKTALQVEGIGNPENFYLTDKNGNMQRPATYADMRVGTFLNSGNVHETNNGPENLWVVSEILGDGKFKAVPKTNIDRIMDEFGKTLPEAIKYETKITDGSTAEQFDMSGKMDVNDPIYKFYDGAVDEYVNKFRKGNVQKITDESGVSWLETAITQADIGPVLAYQSAADIPPEDYEAWLKNGMVPPPDADLAAQDTVGAFQIENELHPQEPGLSPGELEDLEFRRNEVIQRSLDKFQNEEYMAQTTKEAALQQLDDATKFPDFEMNNSYNRFVAAIEAKYPNGRLVNPKLMEQEDVDAFTKYMMGKKGFATMSDVSNHFFTGDAGLTDDEMLDQFKDRYALDQQLKAMVNEPTPQLMRTASEVLAANLTSKIMDQNEIAEVKNIKRLINQANIVQPTPVTITTDEMTVLANHLRDLERGSKIGFKAGEKEAIAATTAKFNQISANKQALIQNLIEYNIRNLPGSERGRFIKAINAAKTTKAGLDVMDRIDTAKEDLEHKEAIGEFKQLTRFTTDKSIPVVMREHIAGILSSYQNSRPTDATLRRLNSLAAYIEGRGSLGIPRDTAALLRRLTQTPIADKTTAEINDIVDQVNQLVAESKLKSQMENTYEEAKLAENVAKLVGSTTNRDPKGDPDSAGYKVAMLMHATSDMGMAPLRVADRMDGVKMFTGENARYMKKIGVAEQTAGIAANADKAWILQKLVDAGIKKLSQDSFDHIFMHSNNDRVGPDLDNHDSVSAAVRATLKSLDLKELRPLTPEEKTVLQIFRAVFEKNRPLAQAVFAEISNEHFAEEPNYLPISYKGDARMSDNEIAMQDRFYKLNVDKGFTKNRLPQVPRVLNTDPAQIFKAIAIQQNFIHMQPTLQEVANVVKSPQYKAMAGKLNTDYWRDHLDIVARGGSSANASIDHKTDPALRLLRSNIQAAKLAANLASLIVRPTDLLQGYAGLGQRYGYVAASRMLGEAMKTFIIPGEAKRVMEQSPELSLRHSAAGGDVATKEIAESLGPNLAKKEGIGGAASNFTRATKQLFMLPVRWVDIRIAATTNETVYKILRDRGMDDATARAEADIATDMMYASASNAYKPHLFAQGERAKALTMFMSYGNNSWDIITHDIIRTGLMKGGKMDEEGNFTAGNYSGRFRAALGLIVLLAGAMLYKSGRDAVNNLTRSKKAKLKEPPLANQALDAAIYSVPVIGPIINAAMSGYQDPGFYFPAFDYIAGDIFYNGYETGKDIVGTQTDKTFKKRQAAGVAAEKAGIKVATGLGAVLGVPGSIPILTMLYDSMLTK